MIFHNPYIQNLPLEDVALQHGDYAYQNLGMIHHILDRRKDSESETQIMYSNRKCTGWLTNLRCTPSIWIFILYFATKLLLQLSYGQKYRFSFTIASWYSNKLSEVLEILESLFRFFNDFLLVSCCLCSSFILVKYCQTNFSSKSLSHFRSSSWLQSLVDDDDVSSLDMNHRITFVQLIRNCSFSLLGCGWNSCTDSTNVH